MIKLYGYGYSYDYSYGCSYDYSDGYGYGNGNGYGHGCKGYGGDIGDGYGNGYGYDSVTPENPSSTATLIDTNPLTLVCQLMCMQTKEGEE